MKSELPPRRSGCGSLLLLTLFCALMSVVVGSTISEAYETPRWLSQVCGFVIIFGVALAAIAAGHWLQRRAQRQAARQNDSLPRPRERV